MQIKRLIYVLVPIIALSPSAMANTEGESDDNGIIISKRETTTSPGGFSSVAEPAGPVDPEAAKRAAEEYAQKCIVPQLEVIMTMGLAPGPPQECTAQVNGTATTT